MYEDARTYKPKKNYNVLFFTMVQHP